MYRKKKIIENFDLFDPKIFLKEIYEIDGLFKKIEQNRWKEIDMNYYSISLSRQKIIKENNLIVEHFDDYYDANEESYETVQKKINNKKYSDEFGIMILIYFIQNF